ncbi:hypothetical protein PQC57_gp110 [Escherichia phage vB_EcoP_WFI101126]|uniref:Uncharacterized protein n=1 Tax=Escherichia phage vB_EcoP_WFI101126 TaxID=2508203 RepID=A0A482MSA7_9CAUD|nr:hypothetical protein PQC57_gp110 [Escherichia phage vB_EcoP_WFI101126]QBQ76538.1 hypothetical protein WFI101126_00110 [Escherichia phage vB_EcoP_WFI101126]
MTAHYWNTKKLLDTMSNQSHNQMLWMLRMDARSLRFQVKIGNFSDGLYYTLKERIKKTHFIMYGIKPRTYVNYMYWNTCYDN